MRLILIRHGQPDEADTNSPHDPPLTGAGRQQALAVADLLQKESITRIICSPLLRARQTAQPLASLTGLPLQVMDGWAEADRHTSRYRSTETLRALGDQEWEKFLSDPITYLGCDPLAFRQEVLQSLQDTVSQTPEGRVAVFTHGMPINVVLSHILGLEKIVHFAPGYGSVTRLRARSTAEMGVVSVNELWHQDT